MGHLAFLGSHAINGVSALHTQLIRQTIFNDMDGVYPGRISNKTNGITVRRWLHRANPGLTRLMTDTLGRRVLFDADALPTSPPTPRTPAFQKDFARPAPPGQGDALAGTIAGPHRHHVDPAALFDVQIKRMHEYKRQLLNVLHAVALYDAIRAQPNRDWVPPREAVRRQGGAGLPHGQAGHPPRARRRPGGEQRTRRSPAASRSSSSPTTTSASPSRSSPPRTSASRSAPPAWRPPAPAT